MRVAVVLFNLGGPDGPEDVQPFLFNLFNDKAIIGAPGPIRWALAKMISSLRASSAIENYNKMGGGSPLVPETEKQAKALETELSKTGVEAKCFLAMRYWKPYVSDAVKAVQTYNPDKVVLLPLYPQFSTTTTGSSLEEWERVGGDEAVTVCCYPTQPYFIQAHVDTIIESWTSGGRPENVRVLFSAHGLPEKVIEAGDPYQWQVEQTVEAVSKHLPHDWEIETCYQSRVGPLKWIGPSTDDAIIRAANERKAIILSPIAFVSEHIETLVELDEEYKEIADEEGAPHYLRVPALGDNPTYIKALSKLVESTLTEQSICSQNKTRLCPNTWSKCPNRKLENAL